MKNLIIFVTLLIFSGCTFTPNVNENAKIDFDIPQSQYQANPVWVVFKKKTVVQELNQELFDSYIKINNKTKVLLFKNKNPNKYSLAVFVGLAPKLLYVKNHEFTEVSDFKMYAFGGDEKLDILKAYKSRMKPFEGTRLEYIKTTVDKMAQEYSDYKLTVVEE